MVYPLRQMITCRHNICIGQTHLLFLIHPACTERQALSQLTATNLEATLLGEFQYPVLFELSTK